VARTAPLSEIQEAADARKRSQRASIAALHLHALRDTRETTAPARTAFLRSFELKVDPDGSLGPEERARRADCLRRAHMRALALRSAEKRAGNQRSKSKAHR
jgi:hypothetical protein